MYISKMKTDAIILQYLWVIPDIEMNSVKFENLKRTENGYKIYFTSYLREDFIDKSVVISLNEDFTINSIFLSSYSFGSVEWINGIGLSESRKWETEEQAESPGYLTRRYTSRLSNGYAPDGFAENILIPDILKSLEDRGIARILKSVLKSKTSHRTINPRICDQSEADGD